ncbi:MAG: T9SS type A sorting domain-containing protein [Pigmentiphaga sp.]|nr:T9SS type A sorting domain-containing protein [Pigmentiphaga sp.]
MKHFLLKLTLLTFMLGIISFVPAQEILLGEYDFSTNSTVPAYQAEGVEFSPNFDIFNETDFNIEINLTGDGFLKVSCYGENVGNNKIYGYLSVTPDPGKTVRITKTVIEHTKVPDSNTNKTRCFLANFGDRDEPTYLGSEFILADVIHQNGGRVIPATLTVETIAPTAIVGFTSKSYISLFATQNSADQVDLSQWLIKNLKFYGEIISSGDISATGSIDFGQVTVGNENEQSVAVSVMGGIDKNVNVELLDESGAFICFTDIIEPIDATAGALIYVTFSPQEPGTYNAQLKFSYDDKVAYTDLSGICPALMETFTEFVTDPELMDEMDGDPVNDYDQENYLTMPGWGFNEGVLWHKSGKYGLGLELRGSDEYVAQAVTPELDLSSPFALTFMGKKMLNEPEILGDLYVLLDDEIIFYDVSPNNSFNGKFAIGFVGKADSKLTFKGIQNPNSQVAIDEIAVYPTDEATLTLPALSTKYVNTELSDVISFDIPFTAYQLKSDLTVALSGNSNDFEVLTPTISKETAEGGATIQVKYTPPTEGTFKSAKIVVQGGGLMSLRTIQFEDAKAMGVSNHTISTKLYGAKGKLHAEVEMPSTIAIYNIDGRLVTTQMITGNAEIPLMSGLYIVKVQVGNERRVEKINVQ